MVALKQPRHLGVCSFPQLEPMLQVLEAHCRVSRPSELGLHEANWRWPTPETFPEWKHFSISTREGDESVLPLQPCVRDVCRQGSQHRVLRLPLTSHLRSDKGIHNLVKLHFSNTYFHFLHGFLIFPEMFFLAVLFISIIG